MVLSKYISFPTKVRILIALKWFLTPNIDLHISNKGKKAFVFLAADYGNLGDVAITYAQKQFLSERLPNHEIIEVPISRTIDGIIAVRRVINKDDLITTVGGGNLGDLYDQIEYLRQLVVRYFPDNKVISFPQTFDFHVGSGKNNGLKKASATYNKHKNLTFVAREQKSYNLMAEHFVKNKVILTPDIVMYLNQIQDSVRRGVVLCMRADGEKNLSQENEQSMLDLVKQSFDTVTVYDTHIDKNHLTSGERELELEKIWKEFRGSELVITDRLHGMIFCYITQTPCIVFQNNNHKVKGCFEWIRESSNIKLIEEFDLEYIDRLFKSQFYRTKRHLSIETKFDVLQQNLA